MTGIPGDFSHVLQRVGQKPSGTVSQDDSRHYSETFSKEVAHWVNREVFKRFPSLRVLPPEGKVDTVFGKGRHGKSLDVSVLDSRSYLLVDVSIKTFNFRDRRTRNYRHNYTGRFYELLGEELDLRKSYAHSVLVAMILLPDDATTATNAKSASCFAMCVKQFSKAARRPTDATPFGFDMVFVGVHSSNGDIYFFDATMRPPRVGHPRTDQQASLEDVLDRMVELYDSRKDVIETAPLPKYKQFEFD